MNPIVLITGATSGFGEATAIKFAQNNYDVIITGRRRNLLQNLEKEIREKYKTEVLSLSFDVRNKSDVLEELYHLPPNWTNIKILINNAGLSRGLEPIQDGNTDDWEEMIDTNVKGLLYVSKALIPGMIARKQGHIINIGSIAGKEVYPNGNVYCATKHAVDALNIAMRMELYQHNIKVTAIHPGMAETEFSLVRFKGNTEKAHKVYEGVTPLYGEDIANAAFYVATLPSHVNINEMTIMPTAQATATMVHRKTT